jgi:hypothetical protein
METEKMPCQKKSCFRTSIIGYDLILVWKYVELFLEFLTCIDFEIKAFEGRRQFFLDPARRGQQPWTPVCITLLKCTKRSFLKFITCGM